MICATCMGENQCTPNPGQKMKRFIAYPLMMMLAIMAWACADAPPIKVGFVGSISGRYSEMGITARNTLQLLTEEFNETGGVRGRPLKLLIKDDIGSPDIAGKALSELVDQGVGFIIGPLTSNMAKATLEAIEGRDVLVISPTMSTDYLAGRDDNLLRLLANNSAQADLLAHHMAEHETQAVAVVWDLGNKQYTQGIIRRFAEQCGHKGIEITAALPFTSGAVDFADMAKSINRSRPEAVLCIMNGLDSAALAQQLRKTGERLALYGTRWTQSNDLITNGGRAVEGMLLASLYSAEKTTPEVASLKTRYLQRFNKEPSSVFTRVCEAYNILLYGMKHAEGGSPEQVKNTILAKEAFDGIGRSIRLDGYGDIIEPIRLVTISNGAFRDVR